MEKEFPKYQCKGLQYIDEQMIKSGTIFMLTPKAWSTSKMIRFELESHLTSSHHPNFYYKKQKEKKKGNNVFF